MSGFSGIPWREAAEIIASELERDCKSLSDFEWDQVWQILALELAVNELQRGTVEIAVRKVCQAAAAQARIKSRADGI